MFAKKTVFVLGAGVGHDYKMPLGKDLKENISSTLTADPDPLWKSLQQELQLETHYGAGIYRECKQFIASNMRKAESIDNFLHTHSENEKLVTIGKSAIASCILDAERASHMMPSNLKTAGRSFIIGVRSDFESWLSRFCTMALTGLIAKDADTAFENVTIVTFNYDRCIEQYIVGHIQKYLGISEEAAQRIANSLTIIHVYGKIGKLPWQSGPGPNVPFGTNPLPQQLNTISKGIRTFTERLEEDDTQKRIESYLAEAELVVFSGFSFGTSNWEFLQNATEGPGKHVIAGMMGISLPNQDIIKHKLQSYLHPRGDVGVSAYPNDFRSLLYDYSGYFE